MISGASEEELELACIRADIMTALDEKYGNYDLLDKLDEYQEKGNYYQVDYANEITKLNAEKQQLISFLEDKIRNYEKDIENSKSYLEHKELFNQVQNNIHTNKCIVNNLQEVLDFINKGGKDE